MPCYTAAGLVNGAGFVPELSPGALVSLFGTDLAWQSRSLTLHDQVPGLGGVQVLINGNMAVVLYISPLQVNFLVPPSLPPGPATVELLRDGAAGGPISVTLKSYAPALFLLEPNIAVANRYPDWALATRENPAAGGEIVTLWAAGLGRLERVVGDLDIPQEANQIAARRQFRVLLNGIPLADEQILYAGCAPGYYGLYQINIKLPGHIDPYPEVRIAVGDFVSPPGVRLLAR